MGWQENRKNYQKAYVLKHFTPFTVMMSKERDKELIEHLRAKQNKSAYIRELIRRDMDEES